MRASWPVEDGLYPCRRQNSGVHDELCRCYRICLPARAPTSSLWPLEAASTKSLRRVGYVGSRRVASSPSESARGQSLAFIYIGMEIEENDCKNCGTCMLENS
jgi:hypothetical protein